MVKVRFAPSPTGIPHVGNIRTALFDYCFARANKGSFILRMEDTDQARKLEGAEEAIKESLSWLGADWDDYVVQSERLEEYQKYARQLVFAGKAIEEEGAIRFLVDPSAEEIKWRDAIGNREIAFKSSDIESFIILKKDGFPTYHLANVVDDHLMGITHVIRGDDWLPSTPKHLLLYRAFDWEEPSFAHVPNVLGTDGKKLSKRRGAKSVLDYKKEGYLSDALFNYLMLLGWAPSNDRTIVSRGEIINEFSLDRVVVAPAIFDEKKLSWLNGEYIRMSKNETLLDLLLEYDPGLAKLDRELAFKLVEPAKTRMKTLADFRTLVSPFMESSSMTSPSPIKDDFFELLTIIIDWNKEAIVAVIKRLNKDKGYSFPDIYNAVIGSKSGLPLADVFEILGKEKTLALLK